MFATLGNSNIEVTEKEKVFKTQTSDEAYHSMADKGVQGPSSSGHLLGPHLLVLSESGKKTNHEQGIGGSLSKRQGLVEGIVQTLGNTR